MTEDVLKKGVSPADNGKLKPGSLNIPGDIKNSIARYMFVYADYINPGNCFWITLVIGLLLIAKKKYMELTVLLPILLCWGTLILAIPATFVYRYAFMYPLSLPFLVLIPFIPKYKMEEEKCLK